MNRAREQLISAVDWLLEFRGFQFHLPNAKHGNDRHVVVWKMRMLLG